jgi:hypothetical protein
VYEGQTQYWGAVLAARSGLIKPEHTRDLIAATAARYDNVKGREWRAVQDTVNDPIVNARRPQGWNNWQRAEDYYSEGELIWLDADTKIRELSGDKKSLNDFARLFFGVDDGVNVAKHYTFEDVVRAQHGAAIRLGAVPAQPPRRPRPGRAAGRPGPRRLETGLHRKADRLPEGAGRTEQVGQLPVLAGLLGGFGRQAGSVPVGRRGLQGRPVRRQRWWP